MLMRFIRREIFWIIIFSAVLYCCAYGPVFYNYLYPPPGRTYLGFNDYPMDYLGNLAIAQRGKLGYWTKDVIISSLYPSIITFVKLEYLIVGHLSRLSTIPVITVFKFFLLVISLDYLKLIWSLISKIFKGKIFRITALFLAFFGTGVVLPENTDFPGYTFGWDKIRQDMQVFQRTTILQYHYMLGAVFSILSLIFLAQFLTKNNRRDFFLAGIFLMLTSHIFAPDAAILICLLPVYLLVRFLRDKSGPDLIRLIPKLVLYISWSFSSLIYQWYISHFYEWNTFPRAERMFAVHLTFTDYIFMVGVVFIPAVFAMPAVFRKGSILLQLCAAWVIAHMVIFFTLDKVIAINSWRFINTPYFVFYAVLGAAGMEIISRKVREKFRIPLWTGIAVMLMLVAAPSFLTYRFSLNYDLERTWYEIPLGYPKTDEYQGLVWLSQNGKPEERVFSAPDSAMLIAGLTPLRIYVGRGGEAHLENYREIVQPIGVFYRNMLDDTQACDFLHKYRMEYVYYGEYEAALNFPQENSKTPSYSCLTPVFSSGSMLIYRVK